MQLTSSGECRPQRVVVAIPAAGVPGTLATTALARALYGGLSASGVQPIVLGLALQPTSWNAHVLQVDCNVTPWLDLPRRLGDRAAARRHGIAKRCPDDPRVSCWRLELELERSFDEAGLVFDDAVVIDTRDVQHLRAMTRVCGRRGIKLVLLSNEALLDRLIQPNRRAAYIRWVATRVDGIWAVSGTLRDFWVNQGVDPKRIHIAPTVVDEAAFSVTTEKVQAGLAVYLGNLTHTESMRLLDIARQVKLTSPTFTLNIYGDASLEQASAFQREIDRLGLVDVVRLHPPVAPSEVPAVLARAELLLLPRASGEFSRAGFPNKLGEYLASSRPVVTTMVGDVPRYLTHGVDAFLAQPDDDAHFAQLIALAMSEPDAATHIGNVGRELARSIFRAQPVAERLVEFVTCLCARPVQVPQRTSALALAVPDPCAMRAALVRLGRRAHIIRTP